MRSAFLRIVALLAVLILAAVLPLAAVSETDACEAPPPHPEPKPEKVEKPWWEIHPPVPPAPPKTKTRTVVRQAETLIETIDAEGYCYTAIKKVNVRSRPSIYSTKVMTISSARTEFNVTARVKNSSGEIWYAVLLANGTLGYIRSDLVNTDHVILLQDPYSYEEQETTKSVPASESASDVINIVTAPEAAQPAVTPQVIYIVQEPAAQPQPTPTPILVYVTPSPEENKDPNPGAEPTPQVIYIYKEKENG